MDTSLLREYQQRAVAYLTEHDKALLCAPAGSGKSRMGAAALSECLGDSNPTVGWLCNTREQAEQAAEALALFKVPGRATVHIACAAAGRDWSDCDALVVDECHHSIAPEWKRQIETLDGVLWGLSATPWGRDAKRNTQLREMFGGNVFVIDREEVGQNLAPARVVWLDACDEGLPERIEAETEKVLKQRMRFRRYQMMSPQQARGEVAWGVCCDLGIRHNRARNALAIATARSHSEPTVILCNTVDHAKELALAVDGVACYSGMKQRAKTIAAFRNGELKRLVSTSMLDEGADLPCIAVLILCGAGRAEGRVIQRAGRALRPFPGKDKAVIHDFLDTTVPLLHNHARTRSRVYIHQKYEQQFPGSMGADSWI